MVFKTSVLKQCFYYDTNIASCNKILVCRVSILLIPYFILKRSDICIEIGFVIHRYLTFLFFFILVHLGE